MCRDGDSLSKYGLGQGQEDTTRMVKLTLGDVCSFGESKTLGWNGLKGVRNEIVRSRSADPGYDASRANQQYSAVNGGTKTGRLRIC